MWSFKIWLVLDQNSVLDVLTSVLTAQCDCMCGLCMYVALCYLRFFSIAVNPHLLPCYKCSHCHCCCHQVYVTVKQLIVGRSSHWWLWSSLFQPHASVLLASFCVVAWNRAVMSFWGIVLWLRGWLLQSSCLGAKLPQQEDPVDPKSLCNSKVRIKMAAFKGIKDHGTRSWCIMAAVAVAGMGRWPWW